MFGPTHLAQTLGMFAIFLLIGIPAFALLVSWAAFRWPGHDAQLVYESGSLGAPAAFREPAEPSYVEHLMRAHGRAAVFHKPDPPLAEPELLDDIAHPPVSPARPFNVTLAALVDEARRYTMPARTPASAPVSPARHASDVVDTSTRASTTIGRHRAPVRVLVAA